MICPQCSRDTPATEPYCINCGVAVDLDVSKVSASFAAEAEAREVRDTQAACRGYLYAALTVLAVVILARVLLVPRLPDAAAVPAYVPAAEARADAVEPLPLEPVELPVPAK